MKNIRVLRISIFVIIATSALIGFAISYSIDPTTSIARLLIDTGALIALLWITHSAPRTDDICVDDIVDGLRDLARNRFDRRLSVKDQDELFQVRQAFNELAGTLSDSRDQSLTHIRYNPTHRLESKGILFSASSHSHHPELGKVQVAFSPDPAEPSKEEQVTEEVLLANSDFTQEASSQHSVSENVTEPLLTTQQELTSAEPAPQENAQTSTIDDLPNRPDSYPSDIKTADFFFLFERFKEAHTQEESNQIDFDDFLMTVQKTREDLIRQHHCRDVKFEVVNSNGAVALRPRLIR